VSRVTKEEVFSKAAELDAKGVKVSVVKIRELLGRGSYSTITKFLEEWQAEEPEVIEAPEVPEAVAGLMPTIWQVCYAEAEKKFHAERQQRHTEIEQLRAELESTKAATDTLENDLEEATRDLENARALHADLIEQKQGLEKHIAKQDGLIEGLRAVLESRPPAPKPERDPRTPDMLEAAAPSASKPTKEKPRKGPEAAQQNAE
jgi:DNA repair exonuclease SbcCD ATPase subunit